MRSLITAIFFISATSAGALAQSATPQQQQQPTCAEALPQIEQMKGQADQLGIDTSTAANQLDTARQARQAGNNPQCMQALVAAQRDIMQRAEAKGLTR